MRGQILIQSPWRLLLVVISLVLLWRFTGLAELGGRARGAIFGLGSNLYWAGAGVRNFWAGLAPGPRLRAELAAKEAASAELVVENARLHSLAAANEELRSLLDLTASLQRQLVNADVLSFNVWLKKNIITLNRGSADGLQPNLAVVAAGGIFIGKITAVTEQTASVLLATDDTSAVAATLARAPDIKAIVRGKAGINLTMELIPQDTDLSAGDVVVTSGLEENTPPGLVLGRIVTVSYKPGQLFKQAALEPALTVANLRAVAVILP